MSGEPRFFIIGTKYARAHDMLPLMLHYRVVSTGFAGDVDLGHLVGKGSDVIRYELDKLIPEEAPLAKSTLVRFLGMRPGDIVALKSHSAPRQSEPRLVVARYAVVSGTTHAKYRLLDDLSHSIEVDFLGDQDPVELPYGYGRTLHEVEDAERIAAIFGPFHYAARAVLATLLSLTDKTTHQSIVGARGAYIMNRVHNELQNAFRNRLVSLYGADAVAQEQGYVDLFVSLPNKLILVEVKASASPMTCVREALGQVLQYAWRLGRDTRHIEFIIVRPRFFNAT